MEGHKQEENSECERKVGRETIKNRAYENVNEMYASFKF